LNYGQQEEEKKSGLIITHDLPSHPKHSAIVKQESQGLGFFFLQFSDIEIWSSFPKHY
jgi:hypothetical protein